MTREKIDPCGDDPMGRLYQNDFTNDLGLLYINGGVRERGTETQESLTKCAKTSILRI